MSYKVTGWVWEYATQTGSEKLTLLALADMCNHEGECFPGVERVAKMVGVTHRRMQQILRKLEMDGVLKIEYEAGLKTKTGNTNRYSILPYISHQQEVGVKSTTPPGVKSTTPEQSVVTVSKERDSMPDGMGGVSDDEKPKKERPANPWYDAIVEVFDLHAKLNGAMQKILQGKANKPPHKDYNLETPLTDPEQLLAWGRWWKANNPDLTIYTSVAKIQSSITGWQCEGMPDVRKSEPQSYPPDHTPTVFDFMGGA